MKIVLSIIVFVALLFIGRTTISVSPFSIHMERPWIVVGIILLVLAIGAIQYDSYCQGSQKVRKELLNKEG